MMMVMMLVLLFLVLVMMVAAVSLLVMMMVMMMLVMMMDRDAVVEGLDDIVVVLILCLVLMRMHALHDLRKHRRFQIVLTGNDAEQLLPAQLCLRCRDDLCLRVDLLHDLYSGIHLFLHRNVGSRKHHRACVEDLVIEELTEIL